MDQSKTNSSSSGTPYLYSGNELDAMSEAQNYYSWILSYFIPYLGDCVIEVGAGTGTFSQRLLESMPDSRFVLLEPAANLFPLLQRRHGQNSRVVVFQGSLQEHAESFTADSVVLVNVLEHIEDDEATLNIIHRILNPGGSLLLFVPALPGLFGTLDRAFKHFRRYTKTELEKKLSNAGFRIEHLRYLNFPGVASWWIAGKLLRRRTLSSADVRFYDRWVVPWCSRLEHICKPPIGQNLLAVGLK